MKSFAVILFCLLAKTSFASNCKSNRQVDITWLSKAYKEAPRSLPVPTIEYGHNATEFREDFLDVVTNFNDELITIILHRAEEIGEELINAVRRLSNDLKKCIKSIETGSKETACADRILKLLTKQYDEFLELIPGNALIKRRALPELPEQTVEIVSKTRKLNAAEVFVNLAENFDGDLRSFYGYASSILLAGWEAARLELNNFQTEIRNKILNTKVLKIYREIGDEIVDSGTQRHVDPETWGPFKDIIDRIGAISDDFNVLENREWSS